VFAAAIGLAALNPVAPFALELEALRRMTPTAFGTLMALEPAIALILGVIALSQTPAVIQLVGIILVVLAGAAAQRPGPDQRAAAEPWVTDVGAVSLANASRQGEAL
jgi:inner membrane transporter RhtA